MRWKPARLYIVDVPGPAVVRLLTNEGLKLFTNRLDDEVGKIMVCTTQTQTQIGTMMSFPDLKRMKKKKDGYLWVCLDPQRLNTNLKRCPHNIPMM